MCVHSVIVDHVRGAERAALDFEPEFWPDESGDSVNPEDEAFGRLRRQEFWQQINARLNSDKERLVVYCSFELGLKPREIYAQHRRAFRGVDEIYRVKENVLARLGRDDELRNLLGADA
jgi:DNA-directed RNA polymerase specialized sigma24 family protein